jgi:hypothetical protein
MRQWREKQTQRIAAIVKEIDADVRQCAGLPG